MDVDSGKPQAKWSRISSMSGHRGIEQNSSIDHGLTCSDGDMPEGQNGVHTALIGWVGEQPEMGQALTERA